VADLVVGPEFGVIRESSTCATETIGTGGAHEKALISCRDRSDGHAPLDQLSQHPIDEFGAERFVDA
jgi:hypothetical protein